MQLMRRRRRSTAPVAAFLAVLGVLGAVDVRAEAPAARAHVDDHAPSFLVLPAKQVNTASKHAVVLDRLLVQALAARGADVLGEADVARIADLAGTQQASDCSSEACVAELADALSADYVVFGEVLRTGDRVRFQASLWQQRDGKVVARGDVSADSVAALGDRIDVLADELVAPLGLVAPGPSPLLVAGGVCAGVGAAIAVVAGVGLGIAGATVADTTNDTNTRRTAQGLALPLLFGTGAGAVVAIVGGVLVGVDVASE